MFKRVVLSIFFLIFFFGISFANNITVKNVAFQNLNTTAGTVELKFDLNWENYYSGTDGNDQTYFDCAWVFVKIYRTDADVWEHAKLVSGGTIGNYSTSTKKGITSDGVGAFCMPGANQTVLWNYTSVPVSLTIASPCVVTYTSHGLAANAEVVFSTNGALPTGITAGTTYYVKSPTANTFNISSTPGGAAINTSGSQSGQHRMLANSLLFTSAVQAKVFAIEMVYIPQGAFNLGSGGAESYAFYKYPTTTNPYTVSSEAAITVGTATNNLCYPTGGNSGDRAGPIPLAYPKGYNAFFIMKYKITQGQYRDFLNTLTRTQQNSRIGTQSAGQFTLYGATSVNYRNGLRNPSVIPAGAITFGCDLNANGVFDEATDGENIPCFLAESDAKAYADWAGLRPRTELEYEKVARGGGIASVANEFPWGTTNYTQVTGIANSGANNETATPAGANLVYGNLAVYGGGSLRAGFSATSNSNREQSGAGYYGVMDLSGGHWEWGITIGHSTGRAFTGLHGDGFLASNGTANVSNWGDRYGGGLRGSSYGDTTLNYYRTSDRVNGYWNSDNRYNTVSSRCARTEQ